MQGATAPRLKIKYDYSTLMICLNFISGKPIRFIENIPEVIYYILHHEYEEPSLAVKKINKTIKDTTNVQITELEFLEMQDRFNASQYYYNECIYHTRKNIDFIV